MPDQENPADLATRGLTLSQLSEQPSWWTGPYWLRQHPSMWPKKPLAMSCKENLEERSVQVSIVTSVKSIEPWNLLYRYSSLNRLLRITAICKRVINQFRGVPNSSLNFPITPQELEAAKLYWITSIQQHYFRQEIKILSKGQPLPRSNPLLRLTPFLDNAGHLRVGGRL